MPKAQPVCMYCTGPVNYGALFCSPECEAMVDDKHFDHGKHLESKGFERNGDTPNLYVKDGVALSLEHIRAVGLDKALLHHQFSVDAKG